MSHQMIASTSPSPKAYNQIPLILVVNEDDELLYNSPDCHWYKILKDFSDDNCTELGADYYNCLHNFNILQKAKNKNKTGSNDETKDDARQRLLFERATMDADQPVLYEPPAVPEVAPIVSASMIAPGITPNYGAGKRPKCFFSLFKSFIGAPLMGFGSEPEQVHDLLRSNLQFARVCGFIPKGQNDPYWQKHVPSLRKLQQFDQIMTEYGLWDKCKRQEITDNLMKGVIRKENSVVGDTTHFHAYSGFETVKYVNKKGKDAKKSQSKVTKNCRCEDWETCPHEWQLADDGAGTIVKARNKYIWGHKASILGLPLQGIPLDAVAVADAATNDGKTFYPHAVKLFEYYPDLSDWFDFALYDSACDYPELKEIFENNLGITLKASLNPRRRQTISDLPQKCMDRLTPYGTLVCKGGVEMDCTGSRYEEEMFIYKAPENTCSSCEYKPVCCPHAENGRTVQIPFTALPHIDPKDPPMSKRFKAMMTRRPSVERMIKRLKCDLGDDRLKKRSNQCFQAYLDKTMIAFHILLRS
jgi:hypothetical protein